MKKYRTRFCIFSMILACCPASIVPGRAARTLQRGQALSRLGQLIEANVFAVHAYQITLARNTGRGDPACYSAGGLSESDLVGIVAHQSSLLKEDVRQVLAWTKRQPSTFNPALDLQPILATPMKLAPNLPVTVITAYLAGGPVADAASIRAMANLYQCCLEMERDGTLLWELMDFYIALGLPTHPTAFGIRGTDEDLLKLGEKLAPLTCSSPFEDDTATPFAWQISSRKIWNWAEKNLHVRDQFEMAKELLAEPEIRVLIPRIKRLPQQKIAIIGHSFTMQSHWSTPGTFASVVGAALEMTNPKVQYRQWAGGGLTASRAYKDFYEDVLSWKPDVVLFAVAMRGEKDLTDLTTMCRGFAGSGSKIVTFDNLRDPSEDAVRNQMSGETATETGLTVIEVGRLLSAAPDKSKFLCLDKIHMTEPYHRLMAREWIKFLVGARDAHLP